MNGRTVGLVALGAAVGTLAVLAELYGPRWLRRRALGVALAAGAVVLTFHMPISWVAVGVICVAVLAVPGDTDRGHPLGAVAHLLVLTSLAGVWVAVPDVEPALVAAGALLPFTVLCLLRGAAPGRWESVLLVAAVVWTVVVGAAGRTPPLAAIATAGTVAVAPLFLGWGVLGRGANRLGARLVAALAAGHVLFAVPVGRIAMRQEVPVALLLALVSVFSQVVIAAAVARSGRLGAPIRSTPAEGGAGSLGGEGHGDGTGGRVTRG